MQVRVTLQNKGFIFEEYVATDDTFRAQKIALARNPGAEVMRSDLLLWLIKRIFYDVVCYRMDNRYTMVIL